jgi:hypothetical protein
VLPSLSLVLIYIPRAYLLEQDSLPSFHHMFYKDGLPKA